MRDMSTRRKSILTIMSRYSNHILYCYINLLIAHNADFLAINGPIFRPRMKEINA